ncbi:MAG TPA: rod-binding protein [Rickettsiales bacterium]|nr:rod-binding protein [Rickettsiales bacterium]
MSDITMTAPVNLTSALQPGSLDTASSGNAKLADTAAANGGARVPTSQIDAVSQDFEAVFLSQMMGAMFSGDELTDFFGGGSTGEIYKSFLMDAYGKSLSKAGGIGIAEQVKKELLKLQEVV